MQWVCNPNIAHIVIQTSDLTTDLIDIQKLFESDAYVEESV